MLAKIIAEKATIDSQLYEAPGIRDGWHDVDLVTCDKMFSKHYTRQILVKQEGEEKAEMVEGVAKKYANKNVHNDPILFYELKDAFIAGANWQSSQQSKRIAELEGALKLITEMSPGTGTTGCTFGDTKYDSLSAVHGYNLALLNCGEIATKVLKGEES